MPRRTTDRQKAKAAVMAALPVAAASADHDGKKTRGVKDQPPLGKEVKGFGSVLAVETLVAAPHAESKRKAASHEPLAAAPRAVIDSGDGSVAHPFRRTVSDTPNEDGCFHCPAARCSCDLIVGLLEASYASVAKKRVEGHRSECALSVLPVFVTRLIEAMKITKDDVFYDLGSGNGSVVFQVAALTGARCVAVELSKTNADLAENAWEHFRSHAAPQLRQRFGKSHTIGTVEFVQGDFSNLIAQKEFLENPRAAVWTSNKLFPSALTHYMSETFRKLPVGARIAANDDLYPHSRSVTRCLDPERFRLFRMEDYVWQEGSVEWCHRDGPFWLYWRV